jgi:hypothetical protein
LKKTAICRALALARAAFKVAGRGEARRPVHDPQQDEGGETAPRGRLVERRSRPTNGEKALGRL